MFKKPSPLKHKEAEGEVLHDTLTKEEHDEKHGVEEPIEEGRDLTKEENKLLESLEWEGGFRPNVEIDQERRDEMVKIMKEREPGSYVYKRSYNTTTKKYERELEDKETKKSIYSSRPTDIPTKKPKEIITPPEEKPKYDFGKTWLKEAEKEVPEKKPFDFGKKRDFDKPKVETIQETKRKYEEQQTSITNNLNEQDKKTVEKSLRKTIVN